MNFQDLKITYDHTDRRNGEHVRYYLFNCDVYGSSQPITKTEIIEDTREALKSIRKYCEGQHVRLKITQKAKRKLRETCAVEKLENLVSRYNKSIK